MTGYAIAMTLWGLLVGCIAMETTNKSDSYSGGERFFYTCVFVIAVGAVGVTADWAVSSLWAAVAGVFQ